MILCAFVKIIITEKIVSKRKIIVIYTNLVTLMEYAFQLKITNSHADAPKVCSINKNNSI